MREPIFTHQLLVPPSLAPLWRIRLGELRGKEPASLERFRITSKASEIVSAFTRAYGGVVSAWGDEFQAILDTNTLDVELGSGQVLSQFYEEWAGGICTRRCDGTKELIAQQSCLCRANKPPAGKDRCSVVTRLIVLCQEVVPCSPGMLTTRSEIMASNFVGMVGLLQAKTAGGTPIAVRLRLEMHKGKNRRYPIVSLEPRYSPDLPGITASTTKEKTSAVLPNPALRTETREESLPVADTGGSAVGVPRINNLRRGLSGAGVGGTKD